MLAAKLGVVHLSHMAPLASFCSLPAATLTMAVCVWPWAGHLVQVAGAGSGAGASAGSVSDVPPAVGSVVVSAAKRPCEPWSKHARWTIPCFMRVGDAPAGPGVVLPIKCPVGVNPLGCDPEF